MEEAFYPGEEEQPERPDGELTEEERQQIAHYVYHKQEYLDHNFDWAERAEKWWKFIRWSIEHGRGYDEFGIEPPFPDTPIPKDIPKQAKHYFRSTQTGI